MIIAWCIVEQGDDMIDYDGWFEGYVKSGIQKHMEKVEPSRGILHAFSLSIWTNYDTYLSPSYPITS